jgi:hypothetical protein
MGKSSVAPCTSLVVNHAGAKSSSLPDLRMTRHNLTNPLYFQRPVYVLVEHPPPEYTQRLDWARVHHMTRQHHQYLTCTAVDAHGRCCRSCRIGVLPCSQHRDIHQYTDTRRFVWRCCTSCPLLSGPMLACSISPEALTILHRLE